MQSVGYSVYYHTAGVGGEGQWSSVAPEQGGPQDWGEHVIAVEDVSGVLYAQEQELSVPPSVYHDKKWCV